jgi:hypothetical protein
MPARGPRLKRDQIRLSHLRPGDNDDETGPAKIFMVLVFDDYVLLAVAEYGEPSKSSAGGLWQWRALPTA